MAILQWSFFYPNRNKEVVFSYQNLIMEDLFKDANGADDAFWSCKEVHLRSLSVLERQQTCYPVQVQSLCESQVKRKEIRKRFMLLQIYLNRSEEKIYE